MRLKDEWSGKANAANVKILLVHNEYAKPSGEEVAFWNTVDLLSREGYQVRTLVLKSSDIRKGAWGSISAGFSGMWSITSAWRMYRICEAFRPDIVHVQNLFPLISAAVLSVAKFWGAAVVYVQHNYRLFCPTGLLLRQGRICVECVSLTELRCIANNCEGKLTRSIAYALRSVISKYELLRYVDMFAVLSKFQRETVVRWGIPPERVASLPNFYDPIWDAAIHKLPELPYVAFLGRLRVEKGIEIINQLARLMPEIEFKIAGHADQLPPSFAFPSNVSLMGELSREEAIRFLRTARVVIIPSVCYETQSYVALEAMWASRAVVASRLGGLSDVVSDGETGYLVDPMNTPEFASRLLTLWKNQNLRESMGLNGAIRVREIYSRRLFAERVANFYKDAIKRTKWQQV